jgi:hypothetical protein
LRPKTAHTWATFVKARHSNQSLEIETFTISWLPKDMPVKPLRIRPVPGRNYSLKETMSLFTTGKHEIGLWGPYEINEHWFREAELRKADLDSGSVEYRVLEREGRSMSGRNQQPEIAHCVHAISRTNHALRAASRPVFAYGELITRRLAEKIHETGLLVNPDVRHDWLLPLLEIETKSLKRHDLDDKWYKMFR